MKCKKCGKEFFEKYSKWSSGDFCSKQCATSFSRTSDVGGKKISNVFNVVKKLK